MEKINIKSAGEIVYKHTLKNGLNIYIWPYQKASDIYLTLTVKYGSIHTNFEVNKKKYSVPNGIAHFLEHVKFNEKGKTAHEKFNELGSYVNAYTTYDHTSYEVMCNDNLHDNLNHLLYFVNNDYFTKDLVEKEKSIICEEASMTKDNPYNEGYFALLNNVYKNDCHKYLITGEKDDIEKITINDVKLVFDNFYTPNNMFLTVTGNVNPYEVIKMCENFYEEKEIKNKNDIKIVYPKETNKINKKESIIKTNVSKEKLFYAVKIPKSKFKDFDDLHIRIYFNLILDINFGLTSIFYDEIISNFIADDFSYQVSVNNNFIILLFEVSSLYPDKILDMIVDKMNNLEIIDVDFKRKNKVYIASSILGYEDAIDVNNDIRNNIIRYGKVIDNYVDIFKNLNIDDINFFMQNIGKESTFVILKPNK